ncbi:hypothetical protein AZE42_11245 [Rhizopogon vesiculosus]|uniref:Uncharacterized protein n=1 Tax=Rhizopogon vesiculosus TaxID=180088 RepID=A0A1J8QGP1_9AGAM|nr:hypothetical protein AZE42_11245 [Rhizopogon vesiculosus]
MLYLESILKQYLPSSDPTKVPIPMTLISDWIVEELQLYQLDYKCCHDPEQRVVEPLYALPYVEGGGFDDEDEDEDEDDDVFLLTVLSVFSDEPESFDARPTQAQIDMLTSLLGSQPQWWVGYAGWC